jgi:hypothetical protein
MMYILFDFFLSQFGDNCPFLMVLAINVMPPNSLLTCLNDSWKNNIISFLLLIIICQIYEEKCEH